MSKTRETWRRLRSLTHLGSLERGLDEEIGFHLDRQIEKNLRAGMPPDEARRRALITFGGVERVKESTRDEFRPALLQDSWRDLRYGLRALRRAPAFTVVAVLTLAVGIGATTAVFSVVNGVLLKPLPYPDADALVWLEHTAPGMSGNGRYRMSAALLATYGQENRSFQELGLWARGTASVVGDAAPEEVEKVDVTHGALRALGIQPALGRWFAPEDHTLGSDEVVMLSAGFWQRRFGGASAIVGTPILVDGRPRTVIGVMPPGFQLLDRAPDLILPVRFQTSDLTLGQFNYSGVARLLPGVTIAQANADVARMLPIWLNAWPSFPGIDREAFEKARPTPALAPLKHAVVGDIGNVLWVLMGTIGLVLLIACANVANLLLVRAEGRQHELAVRAALGAGRVRLAREMLLESLVLGLLGGALGLALAAAGLRLLVTIGPATLPRLRDITLDPIVMMFALIISLLSVVLFGCIPIVRHASWKIAHPLRASGRTSSDSRERHRTRNALVVVQVALALILLIGSGLMVRTFMAMRAVQPGFADPHHVQLVRVTIPAAQIPEPARVLQMQTEMRDRMAAMSGVSAVSFAGAVPLDAATGRSTVYAEDDATRGERPSVMRWFRFVAPGFFQTVGTPVVAGRDFTMSELVERRTVAVISENMARELWGEPALAVGKRIRATKDNPWREIVGVVGDVYNEGVHRPAPTVVYWPSLMENHFEVRVAVQRAVTFAVRSDRAGSEGLQNEIREAIWAVNPNLPLTRIMTLGDVYERSLAGASFTLVMLAIAAAMALLLGIIGIYGVIAYAVSQRTREIGIRVALGARHAELQGMFVRHGVVLAAIGVVCGLAGAAVLTRLMASLLFGTSPLDPMTYALVSLGLVGIAALASYIPAHGALSVDPVRALRGE